MLNFMGMAGNYEERKVALDKYDWGFISTAQVTDAGQPYETAIDCRLYVNNIEGHNRSMCIVEAYDTRKEAALGHKRWVDIMTKGKMPDQLTDCANAEIAKLHDMMTGEPKVFTLSPPPGGGK